MSVRLSSSAAIPRLLLLGFLITTSGTELAAAAETPPAAPPRNQFTPPPPTPEQKKGEAIYQQRCASCHESGGERIPPGYLIRWLSVEHIERMLTSGVMQPQAAGLAKDEITAVAVYLSRYRNADAREADPTPNPCNSKAKSIALREPLWNGWGRDLENTRYQPKPGLTATDLPRLKVKWAWAYPGQYAQSQPTIVGDRVIVSSSVGRITALDTNTGCERWVYDGGVGAKSSVVVGQLPRGAPAKFAAFYGDEKSFAHAIDATTGKGLWKTKIDEHPISRVTGTPKYFDGRLYVPLSSYEEGAGSDSKYQCCTFRGNVVALDAVTGKILWKNYVIAQEPKPFKKNTSGTQMFGPAGGAVWSTVALDTKRRLVYVATGNSYTDVTEEGSDAIVAFEMDTGVRKWAKQVTHDDAYLVRCSGDFAGKENCPQKNGPDHDFGSPPILKTLADGKQIIVASQKSGVVYGLDPDNQGNVLWQTKVGRGSALGGIEHGSAADNENAYAPVSDMRGEGARPGLTAVDLATGKIKWHTPTPEAVCVWGKERCVRAQGSAATVIPGVVFSGAFDGHLRAYSTQDGKILWDFDTAAAPMQTVNGLKASGGSIDGGGATLANGMLFINSGYGNFAYGGRLLLAFTVNGK